MYTNLEIIAQLTGHEEEAADLIESLQARVAAVDEKVAPLSYAPTVYYELDATDPTKPYTAGPGTFVDLLIARAGGINIGSSLQGQWAEISLEQLIVSDPAIIILGALMQIGSGSVLVVVLAALSVFMAGINIFGGFMVTRRMLAMFQKS